MRILLVVLAAAVLVYVAVRLIERRNGRPSAGGSPVDRQPDPWSEAAYRRAVRERAERQRSGTPEPETPAPVVAFDEGVFACNDSGDSMAEYFVVRCAAQPAAVAAAVARANDRFMLVDEDGREHRDWHDLEAPGWDLYTPNYTADPVVTDEGVKGYVDCKGVIPAAMGETFRRILREELEALGTPATVHEQRG